MSYKSLLVHLNRAERCEAVLDTAIDLARRYNMHLIGLYLRPRIQSALTIDSLGHANILVDEVAAEHKNETTIRATFERMTTGQPWTSEWRAVAATLPDFAGNALEHAHVADLVVASQSDPEWEQSSRLDFPERLILESGRPVLLVPYVGNYREIGRTIVIAWKPGRESARAVFNAIPILKTANSVHILQIAERRREAIAPAIGLASALVRHGIKAELQSSQAVDHSICSELLSRLADLSADLLVMGAYGHTRLREYVFGGATRDITHSMTVPTLFSH